MRTVTTSADYEGVHATIMDGDEVVARGYAFVSKHGSWEGAKNAAIAAARVKLDSFRAYGPPPADETAELEDGLRAV